ncbi:MAG: ABC transporter permease subunit [Candidatus Omnitrophota bacterium]
MNAIWIIAQNTIKALVRKKDFYVFLIMLLVLLILLLTQSFFGIDDISRFIKDIGYTCVWIFALIISVTFSAKQIPEELAAKTILTLLAKPVSRAQFLLGRFLGSILASATAYTMFYIVYIYVIFLKGEGVAPVLLAQSYLLGIFFLSVVCAISILLSTLLTFPAALSISFIAYFTSTYFADSLRASMLSLKGVAALVATPIYYLMPHYEFFDMRVRITHSWEPLPLWVFAAIMAYAASYSSVILYISYRKTKNEFL